MNIYINNGETKIPEDETCYIVAKGGIYLRKKLDLIESLTPVDKISFLEDIPVFAKLNIPKISLLMFGNILAFFKEVYKLYKSEAVILIYFNKNKRTFKLYTPEQEVSGASLKYKSDQTIKDYLLVGSIHSHGSMSAFHSGTDVGDEKNFDGIHFTVGKVNEDQFFDICGSVVSNGLRVPILPEEYINGLEVREFTNYFSSMFRPSFEIINGEKVYKSMVKTSVGYSLSDNSENILTFNSKWLEKVKEKQYTYSSGGASVYKFVNGELIKIEDNDQEKKKIKNNYSQFNLFDFDYSDFEDFDCSTSKIDPCENCVHRKTKELEVLSNKKSLDEKRKNYYLNEDYWDAF